MPLPALGQATESTLNPYVGRDLPWLLRSWVSATPDATFLVWAAPDGTETRWTYAQFAADVERVAAGLHSLGLREGERLLIHADNSPEGVLAWFACARLGIVTINTNTRSVGAELEFFLTHSKAVGAIVHESFTGELFPVAGHLRAVVVVPDPFGRASTPTSELGTEPGSAAEAQTLPPERIHHWEPLIAPFTGTSADHLEVPELPVDPMRPLTIQYTSGTTSRPKAVVFTHGNALWGGQSGAGNMRLTQADTQLVFLPFFHINALSWGFWSSLWSGGAVVLQRKFSASRFWDVSLRHRITVASMIPFSFKAIWAQPVPEHQYRVWSTGVKLHAVEEHFGVTTFATWGMTETCTHATRSDLSIDSPETNIGMPSPGYQIAITDPVTGGPAPDGTNGDLWVRGTRGVQLFLEYLDNEAANEAAFTQDGWFRTGDMARVGPDGWLIFGDRDKDMLKVGGENVSARQVEETILGALPRGEVDSVAIVARPHPMLGEVPVAFVVRGAAAGLSADELSAAIDQACRAALSDFKRPREVIELESFPMGTLAKVNKVLLRELAAESASDPQ